MEKVKKLYGAVELNNKFHGLKTGKIYKLSLRENILQIFLTFISDKEKKVFLSFVGYIVCYLIRTCIQTLQ